MRSIDLIFVIGLGIAMGSILGKVWSVSPTGLVLYQVGVICVMWLILRTAITGVKWLWQYISAQQFMSLDYWYSGSASGSLRTPMRKRPRANGAIRPPEPVDNSTLDNFLRNLDQR